MMGGTSCDVMWVIAWHTCLVYLVLSAFLFFFTIGFSCYWLSGAGGELQCAILTCIILGITGQMLHVLTNLIWNSSREDGDQV